MTAKPGEITHPDKVLFPDAGITKGEMAAYYEAIAPLMLPHLRGRPITMERFPAGIGEEGFLQKDVKKGFPDWLQRVEAPKKDGVVHYVIATDLNSLLWMVNQNTITPHVWVSRAPDLLHPDICVFDLDPAEAIAGPDGDEAQAAAAAKRSSPAVLRKTALALRDLLDELGLPSWIKTSGSKGFHIVVPLDGKADSEVVSHFAHAVGALLVTRDPEHLTQEFSKVDRGGRILVDTGRNGYGATFAAAYAVRAKPGAPVSAPCTWDELASGDVSPRTFTLRTMAARVEKVGDLWAELRTRKRSLKQAIARLRRLIEPGR
jgi:bifunctional non-homologous end joining protein LigD